MANIKYTEQDVINNIKNADSYRSLLNLLGVKAKGDNYNRLKIIISKLNLDCTHFTGQGWRKNKTFIHERTKPEEILVKNSIYTSGLHRSSNRIKTLLFTSNLKEKKCECCNLNIWLGNIIPLELHHIDGDNKNNCIENLQILCPNCHSLTNNFRGKKLKKGK